MNITEKIDNTILDMVFENKEVKEQLYLLESQRSEGSVDSRETKKTIMQEVKKWVRMPTDKLMRESEKYFDKMVQQLKKNGKEKDVLRVLNKRSGTNYKSLADVKIVSEGRMKYNDSEAYYRFVSNIKRGFGDVMATILTTLGVMAAVGTGLVAGPAAIGVIVGGVVFWSAAVAINHMIPYEAMKYHAEVDQMKMNYTKSP